MATRTTTSDPVGLYLREIAGHELLTAEDEVVLARRIEAGNAARATLQGSAGLGSRERHQLREIAEDGDRARRRFIAANLRLVVSIAGRYTGRGMDLLDIVQEGNLGLMHAVDKFDWRKGFKFSTYASWWIRQAIARGLGNQGRTIRLPVHLLDVVRQVRDTAELLRLELHRAPTVNEISDTCGVAPDAVRNALSTCDDAVSLDRPIGDDGSMELGDLIASEGTDEPIHVAEEADRRARLRNAIGHLGATEREVITERFGLLGAPQTLASIAARLHMTRERVRQIEARAMSKLRHPSTGDSLVGLL